MLFRPLLQLGTARRVNILPRKRQLPEASLEATANSIG